MVTTRRNRFAGRNQEFHFGRIKLEKPIKHPNELVKYEHSLNYNLLSELDQHFYLKKICNFLFYE